MWQFLRELLCLHDWEKTSERTFVSGWSALSPRIDVPTMVRRHFMCRKCDKVRVVDSPWRSNWE